MATTGQKFTAPPVPWAMEYSDRVPKQRYYAPEFFAMEAELFWPRVWQMACGSDRIAGNLFRSAVGA